MVPLIVGQHSGVDGFKLATTECIEDGDAVERLTTAHGRAADATVRRQWQLGVPICGGSRSQRMGQQRRHDECSWQ